MKYNDDGGPGLPDAGVPGQQDSSEPLRFLSDTLSLQDWAREEMKKGIFTPLHDGSLYLNQVKSSLPVSYLPGFLTVSHPYSTEPWYTYLKTDAWNAESLFDTVQGSLSLASRILKVKRINIKNYAVLFGSPEGYDIGNILVQHPMYWSCSKKAVDERLPRVNNVNNPYNNNEPGHAPSLMVMGSGYLNNAGAALLRVSYSPQGEGAQSYYRWAILPPLDFIEVSLAFDHSTPFQFEFAVLVNGRPCVPGAYAWCGSGHTAALCAIWRGHGTCPADNLFFSGWDYNPNPLANGAACTEASKDVRQWGYDIAMNGKSFKTIPDASPSAAEVPSAGGEITLSVSSGLQEDAWVLNDTMANGNEGAWCIQSSHKVVSGNGDIALSIAPNTTGEERKLWLFVGHQYGEARVVEIKQAAS